MYQGSLIISENPLIKGERIWVDITVNFGCFESEDETAEYAMKAKSILFFKENQIYVKVTSLNKEWLCSNKDIVFRTLSDKKQAEMGPPLNPSNPEDFQTILNTINENGTTNPRYTVSEEDFIEFDFSLEELVEFYKEGYRLDCIAYGTNKID